jgi:hypothetical protein
MRAHEMAVETNEVGVSLEARLASLTDVGAEILKRWAVTADRHAAAVSQFEAHLRELSTAGTQLHDQTSQRLRDLEQIIQQEWDALRQVHEAPVKSLLEQAASLTEVCVATANSAQSGFDRAEMRLLALESEFHRTTAELTREIHALMAEVRSASSIGQRQLLGQTPSTPSWPLEGVTRLHNQLREAGGPQMTPIRALPEAAAPELEASPAPAATTAAVPGRGRAATIALSIVAVVIVAGGVFVWRLERDVRASADRVSASQRQLQVAAEAAVRTAAERQQEAARQVAAAQQLANRAQTIGDVLAAPDLVRYPLTGRDALPAATGQVLWSRSRGLVFSASGLPAPPANSRYSLWLLTRTGPIGAGMFVPDSNGRATLAITPKVPMPLIGAMITLEPTGGSDKPSGEPLLARLPAPPPAT